MTPHEVVELKNGCQRIVADPTFAVVFDLMRKNYMAEILATDAGQSEVRELLYNAAKGLDALEMQIDNFANGDIV